MGIHTSLIDAVWNALENYDGTKNEWSRKFKTSDDVAGFEQNGIKPHDIGDKAAVVVKSQEIDLTLRTSQGINWPVALRVDVFVKTNRYREAHDLIESVIDAVYRATPEAETRTYIEVTTCGPPATVGNVKVVKQEFGDTPAKFVCWNASAVFVFTKQRAA